MASPKIPDPPPPPPMPKMPEPPKPPEPEKKLKPEIDKDAKRQQEALRRRRGLSSTMLTGGQGLGSPAPVGKKKLLGG